MLELSDEAAGLIAELVARSDLPTGAGLRIAQRDDHSALAMTLRAGPAPDDVLILDKHVAVFLGPIAARRVEGQTLDATKTDANTAFFLRD